MYLTEIAMVKCSYFLASCALFFASAMTLAQLPPATRPATTVPAPSTSFEKEIVAYEAADRENFPPSGAVLFAGDSGVRLWKTLTDDFPEHKVINRGFGG